jgi:hypothetical protein
MNPAQDPVAEHFASIAQSTMTAAPAPRPFAVVRILAERRRSEMAVHRTLALLTVASLAPLVVVLLASALQPGSGAGGRFAALNLALTLVPAIAAVARLLGTPRPVRV